MLKLGFLGRLFGESTKEEKTMTKLNIGIILGSTRQGRVSPQVGEWVKGIADKRMMQTMKSLISQTLIYHS